MLKDDKKKLPPVIYAYHDYRDFLRDSFQFLKQTQKKSLRNIAQSLDVSVATLSMILSQKRTLQEDTCLEIIKLLELNPSEESYFKQLMIIADSDSFSDRSKALKTIQNFGNYKKFNAKEIEVYQYLSRWYYVAIREMTALPDFVLSANWIQKRLRHKVSLADIDQAISFLINNKYIEVDLQGKVKRPEVNLQCLTGVYRHSLGEYYRQMFELAHEAFEKVPREKRNFMSHTIAIPEAQSEEFLNVVGDFIERIVSKSNTSESPKSKADVVYHFALQAFPLSKKIEEGE